MSKVADLLRADAIHIERDMLHWIGEQFEVIRWNIERWEPRPCPPPGGEFDTEPSQAWLTRIDGEMYGDREGTR